MDNGLTHGIQVGKVELMIWSRAPPQDQYDYSYGVKSLNGKDKTRNSRAKQENSWRNVEELTLWIEMKAIYLRVSKVSIYING